MEEKKNLIQSTPLLLEVVKSDDNVTYILRSPQQGQVLCITNSVDELAEFLRSF